MRRTIYNAEHEAFRDAVRAFLERSVVPYHDEFVADRAIPREVWLEAGKHGFLGLDIPEEYGGSAAGDYRFNAVLSEELATVSVGLASALSIHYDVVAGYLAELTTTAQKHRWLPDFCSGAVHTAIAMTEPSGGSDLARLKTSAVRDGRGWRVNGSKTFITNGASAGLVVVAARTSDEPGARGISLFVVESDRRGFTVGSKLDKIGQAEVDTAELFFSDVYVPDDNRLGELGRGFAYMMQRLPRERIGAAIANLAHARTILAETLVYVRDRRAFGVAIGSFQHNKFTLADLVTQLDVTQAYIDQCIGAVARDELTAVDAAKAKWWTADLQNKVIDACLQLHGGYGYMTEQRVARAWMDARVTKIWAGTNEIMKEVIGRDLGL
jgi:alkylation response protein AidB-like acyl-CoA dehydrogenase